MHRWFLVWLLVIMASCMCALQVSQEAVQIAEALSAQIQTQEPLILQVDAGEWTTALEQELSARLLNQGADLRIPQMSDPALVADSLGSELNLSRYGVGSALLVRISLNLKWEEHASTGFFSYHSTRIPVYSFITSQIELPGWRLVKRSSYDFHRPAAKQTEASGLRLKWFEPLIASTAIVSMIFLLWNFN